MSAAEKISRIGGDDTPGIPPRDIPPRDVPRRDLSPRDALAVLVADGDHPSIGAAYEVARMRTWVDLPTAGRFFGVGKNASYDLRKRGEFPVRVLMFGGQYVVLTSDLLAALGLPLTA